MSIIDIEGASRYYAPMPQTTRAMNVSLPPEQEGYIRDLVKSGRYSSASEVVRTGLRLLEAQEMKLADLRRLIHEGLESGTPVEVTREQMRELIGRRMAELRGEVERGERPAPGGADSVSV